MPHARKLAAGLALVAAPAWADISRPVAAQSQGWPQWAVVAVTFALFLSLIVVVSRFFRGSRGGSGGNNKSDNGNNDLFGP